MYISGGALSRKPQEARDRLLPGARRRALGDHLAGDDLDGRSQAGHPDFLVHPLPGRRMSPLRPVGTTAYSPGFQPGVAAPKGRWRRRDE
jgi:hypothetical protein